MNLFREKESVVMAKSNGPQGHRTWPHGSYVWGILQDAVDITHISTSTETLKIRFL
jgi:hypothetical protein